MFCAMAQTDKHNFKKTEDFYSKMKYTCDNSLKHKEDPYNDIDDIGDNNDDNDNDDDDDHIDGGLMNITNIMKYKEHTNYSLPRHERYEEVDYDHFHGEDEDDDDEGEYDDEGGRFGKLENNGTIQSNESNNDIETSEKNIQQGDTHPPNRLNSHSSGYLVPCPNNINHSGETCPPDPIIYITNILHASRKHKNTNSLQERNRQAADFPSSHYQDIPSSHFQDFPSSSQEHTRPTLRAKNCQKMCKAKKFNFCQSSSFAKEMEQQFKASQNCHKSTPTMNFDAGRRLLLKIRLCRAFKLIFAFNLLVGLSMLLMTTYVVHYKARNERVRTEINIGKYGMRMKSNSSNGDIGEGWWTIKSWQELPSRDLVERNTSEPSDLVDVIRYDSSTGKFHVNVDGFYHIFCRLYTLPDGKMVRAELVLPMEKYESNYSAPWCQRNDEPGKVCLSTTMSKFVLLEKGQHFYVTVKNKLMTNIDSYLFVHIM